ncbi:MAG: hypothetical protein Fur0020_03150 [Thermodesulfovibrionia bacterium]
MPIRVAEKVVDFVFKNTPPEEKIDIGFFGGEPLLEFGLIKEIVGMIEKHPSFNNEQVELTVVTNGTIFSDEIADFLKIHNIGFCVSCDGPPFVQDMFRCFPNGKGSSDIVENTIRQALEVFPSILVNAVYHPKTFRYLPQVIEYLSSLGIRQIYLNPDFSAPWLKKEADLLPKIYRQIAEQYIDYYLLHRPHFISLIDSKITVILRGGYNPLERCRMGKGEFAFTPSGNIYPCERLIGSDIGDDHRIGTIYDGLNLEHLSCKMTAEQSTNTECLSCGLKDYCMNWCGCSNYFSSGYYNRVGPFLCASEKTAIQTAFNVFKTLEKKLGPTFIDHIAGIPAMNSVERR